jgi:hypothetical protein
VEETDSRANNLHSRSPNCSNLPSNSTMEEDDGFETVWRKEDYLLPPGSIDFADNILVGVCLLPSVPRLLTPNCGPPCFIFVKFMFPQKRFSKIGARNRIYEVLSETQSICSLCLVEPRFWIKPYTTREQQAIVPLLVFRGLALDSESNTPQFMVSPLLGIWATNVSLFCLLFAFCLAKVGPRITNIAFIAFKPQHRCGLGRGFWDSFWTLSNRRSNQGGS